MCSFNIVYSNTVVLACQNAQFMLFFAQLFNDISQRFFLTDANKLYLLIRNAFTIIHQVAAFLVMMRLHILQRFQQRFHVVVLHPVQS